ncbi:hypothetical protein BH18CHL2_BH18CHL2_08260 [soil metagenome]
MQDLRGPRVGTIGFCMGGTFALQIAAPRAHLAAVSYYGFPAARDHKSAPSHDRACESWMRRLDFWRRELAA